MTGQTVRDLSPLSISVLGMPWIVQLLEIFIEIVSLWGDGCGWLLIILRPKR